MLSSRTCVRGRANRVVVLSRKEKSSPIPSTAPPQTQDGTNLRRSARIQTTLRKSAREVRSPPASNVQASRSASARQPPLTGEASPAAEAIPTDTISPPGNTSTDTGRVDASPNDTEAVADACAVYTSKDLKFINKDRREIPPKVVFKDSWPVGHSVELETYSTSSGQFGLPVLW